MTNMRPGGAVQLQDYSWIPSDPDRAHTDKACIHLLNIMLAKPERLRLQLNDVANSSLT